ncbi:unnamed protein product (macronuclear) [Paramecium tetraurelia]|uniref:Uncharacterized protein n=1 Tax=Paramecium tetraurelia TaxID=5888 RepID=A0CET7_PARTE|nr:uncharacterized protein GSPATT00037743001 [Paramecium tetraurelia]CAK69304.1 unnamed protein product [Paramecium tetraurelia]|eukprot:XP_001436701.1 hypothetical protein (macronuclear) [Paramecium tetraurelia strain d4-2]
MKQIRMGNKVLSRKIESNLQPKASKQQWQNVGKQEEIILNSEEPEQFIEEEIIQINPKTGKLERKIVRKPLNNEEIDNLQMGQNLEEDLGNGKQVISRKIVQNDQSNQALKQQGWIKNNEGNMEIKFQPEPVKYVEEEILVQGEDGVVQRKLIRRPFLPQDNKLQTGAVIEQDLNGNKVVSRKIVSNNKPVDSTWVQLNNGQLEKIVSQEEPEAYIEEEIIIINPKTQKQERKINQKTFDSIRKQVKLRENLQEGDGTRKVVARRIVRHWQSKQGQMEIQLAQNEPTKYVEEEVLCYGENGIQRKLVRRPLTKENQQMGNNLNEVDKDGNRILSRKIVDNSQSFNQVQKDWQKGQNGTLEKIISQEEPEQYIEEEIIIINPKTGKQERKLVRRPYENDEEIGDQLNESIGNNQKVVARRIVQNDSSLNEWKKNQKTGQLEKPNILRKKVLVMNEETGKMERKLVRKQYQPGLNVGNNIQENDSNGNKILARRIVENTSSTQQVEKEGWKNNQGNYEKTLSIHEPTKFIEEEVIIMRQGGKQERKIIRRPLDEDENIEEGEQLLEDLGEGYYVVSRKIVDNDLSLTSSKWKKNNDGNYEQSLGVEPSQYITEEVLQVNNETGMMERKLVRKPYLGGKVQEGDSLNEVDKNGNKVLSRKIESNLQPKASKQQWQNVGKQEEIILNSEEPEQFIEEEIIQINPKTGKLERKIKQIIYRWDKTQKKIQEMVNKQFQGKLFKMINQIKP